MTYKEHYKAVIAHVQKTNGDLRMVPMYETMPRHAAEKVLIELDHSGLVARTGTPGLQRQNRIIAPGKTPADVVAYLTEKAEAAPAKQWKNCVEDDRRYDPASSILIVGGPCAVFERGHWFPRCDFAATLLEACWEPGMVVRLRTRDKKERSFIVCGDVAPLDCDMPDSQWLEEVQLMNGEWLRVIGGKIIIPHAGKRVTLQEVQP